MPKLSTALHAEYEYVLNSNTKDKKIITCKKYSKEKSRSWMNDPNYQDEKNASNDEIALK